MSLTPVCDHLALLCLDHSEAEYHDDKGREYKIWSSCSRRDQDSMYPKNTLPVTYFISLGDSTKDLGFNIWVCEGISYLGHSIDIAIGWNQAGKHLKKLPLCLDCICSAFQYQVKKKQGKKPFWSHFWHQVSKINISRRNMFFTVDILEGLIPVFLYVFDINS